MKEIELVWSATMAQENHTPTHNLRPEQDVGDITFAPGLRIAYLTQIRDIDESATLEEELNRRGHQFKELEEEIRPLKLKWLTLVLRG